MHSMIIYAQYQDSTQHIGFAEYEFNQQILDSIQLFPIYATAVRPFQEKRQLLIALWLLALTIKLFHIHESKGRTFFTFFSSHSSFCQPQIGPSNDFSIYFSI